MDANTLISIARQGNRLGQFPLSAVRAGLANGKFTTKDYYWATGMQSWEPLDQLPPEEKPQPPAPEMTPEEPVSPALQPPVPTLPTSQTSSAPSNQAAPKPAPAPSAPPPPLPISVPADWRKTAYTILLTIGVVEFLYGLTTSPDGSAIRQQVLVQHMTNGLLFAILALMVRKLD